MEKYFEILRRCSLFTGIDHENMVPMLSCLGARVERFRKDEMIWAEGDPAGDLGIVLSGTVQIVRMDYYGNRSIVTTVEPSQIFGETFACAQVNTMPVDVVVSSDTEVLLVDASRITRTCSSACDFHRQILFNLLQVMAIKNLVFHQKIEITSKRTTREKLLTYLHIQAQKYNSNSFTIPFDRQELADYLEVDRSGLSAEISKLRREGILHCEKSRFTLLNYGEIISRNL